MTGRGRVLVVDDDRTNRMMLTYRLEVDGLETATAENGRTAIDMLRNEHFDVVLLDIIMPDLDGYATLELIKNDSWLSGTPIIMMSTLGEMDSVIRCLELGAEDYLPKPLDSLLLASRVNGIVLRGEMQRMRDGYEHDIDALAASLSAKTSNESRLETIANFAGHEGAVGRLAQELKNLVSAPDSHGPT